MIDWLSGIWEAVAVFLTAIDWSFWGVWSLTVSLLLLGLIGAVLIVMRPSVAVSPPSMRLGPISWPQRAPSLKPAARASAS